MALRVERGDYEIIDTRARQPAGRTVAIRGIPRSIPVRAILERRLNERAVDEIKRSPGARRKPGGQDKIIDGHHVAVRKRQIVVTAYGRIDDLQRNGDA